MSGRVNSASSMLREKEHVRVLVYSISIVNDLPNMYGTRLWYCTMWGYKRASCGEPKQHTKRAPLPSSDSPTTNNYIDSEPYLYVILNTCRQRCGYVPTSGTTRKYEYNHGPYRPLPVRRNTPQALFEARKYEGRESKCCLLYTSPSPRDLSTSRMPSSA